jgi:hypothetical protein
MAFEEGGLNQESFFTPPPYQLGRNRLPGSRPLAVFFEQADCHACDILHSDPLVDARVRSKLEAMDVVQIDLWSNAPVVTPAGERTTARAWARKLGLFYTPTLVFFDEQGREISVAVLGSGQGARCLGSVEIRPAEGLYDYAAKYQRDDTRYLVPAPVSPALQKRLAELALAAHRLLECSGATRTDFLWDGGSDPVVLELNTLPGLTSHSLLPKIAAHAGMSYEDLIEAILQDAGLKNALQGERAGEGTRP